MKKHRIQINGWLNIDKPIGVTSARVVAIVKRLTNANKVGHAGTLDPLATGILPIALGEATKTVQFLMDSKKTYRFTVSFGNATNTDDMEGEVINTSDVIPSEDEIISAIPEFIGEIEQIPPAFSAIKINGERSYKLARKGESIEIPPRNVTVYSLDLVDMHSKQEAEFEMTCSKGTYVRSIARDLGQKLGTFAHVSVLRRKKTGVFDESSTISLEKLESLVHNASPSDWKSEVLLPVEAVLDDIPVLHLDICSTNLLRNGQHIELSESKAESGLASVFCDDKFALIGLVEGKSLKPARVFNL